jgi:hypothetical protein
MKTNLVNDFMGTFIEEGWSIVEKELQAVKPSIRSAMNPRGTRTIESPLDAYNFVVSDQLKSVIVFSMYTVVSLISYH